MDDFSPEPPEPASAKAKLLAFLRSYGTAILSVLLFVVALGALHHGLADVHLKDVMAEIEAQPASRLFWAVALTFGSYFLLSLYDYIGLFYIHRRLPYPDVALAAFIGYAFSNSTGQALLVGVPIRFRLYAAYGVSAFDVGKLLVYSAAMIWVGFVAAAGLVFAIVPLALPPSLPLPFTTTQPLGLLFIGLTLVFSGLSIFARKPVVWRRFKFEMPRPLLAFPQMIAAGADWVLAGTVLYLLVPESTGLEWWIFIAAFLLAQMVAQASQVPGGLGIFESTILVLTGPSNPAALIGALVLYRLIYYVMPLVLGVALLLAREIAERREKISSLARAFNRHLPEMAPPAFAIGGLVAGIVLVFSVALPTHPERLDLLRELMPLPLVELSHLVATLAGVGLLLLAPAVDRRLEGAWRWTGILLAVGSAASLVKGLDYEEAILLGLLLIALLPARRHFERRSPLLHEPFSPAWMVTVVIIFASAIWLGFFAHKHIPYSADLWWSFTFEGEASRGLRAAVGALVLIFCFTLVHLRGSSPPSGERESEPVE